MTNLNLKTIQKCLDDYMLRKGKTEIGDIEANQVLAVAGVINDDQAHPGRPLREILRKLRDTNLLPQNVRQFQGLWTIKHSKTCLLYTSPSPRDRTRSRMPSSA